MKKFIALALTFATIITLAGCKPADNDYVKLAKKHGYWYGLGGISWGMTIDECVDVLGVEVMDSSNNMPESIPLGEAFITEPVAYQSDYDKTEVLSAKFEAYGKPVTAVILFYDWSPTDENGGSLGFIQLTFDEPSSTVDELFEPILSELESQGLTYESEQNVKSNPKKLSDLKESPARDEAVAFLQAQQDLIDENLDTPAPSFVEKLTERPLDSMSTFLYSTPSDDFTKSTILLYGTTAATFATIEVGRTP